MRYAAIVGLLLAGGCLGGCVQTGSASYRIITPVGEYGFDHIVNEDTEYKVSFDPSGWAWWSEIWAKDTLAPVAEGD